jgi:alkaline phosphatase
MRLRPPALLLFMLTVLAACAGPRAASVQTSTFVEVRPRNVIYFVTDGFGPASATFARDYGHGLAAPRTLAFDTALVGTIQTWATDSRVTDSAAGGTALAAGVKTYNGAIAVDTTGRPVATVLEGAKARGMATGVVVTSRITHATPACFTAHVGSRIQENEIALQQVRLAPDVFIGGGRRQFVPRESGGFRTDGKHLLDTLRARGFTVATDRAGYDAARRAPFAALLADDHLAYELDRDPAREPSLAEMTTKAIDLLRGDTDGFFLMVEASRIDHAGHGNDAAAHLHDILAFEAAWRAAVDFARRDGNTLVVSTSDHETGGLSLGRNLAGRGVYAWRPEVVGRVRASHDVLIPRLQAAYRQDTTGASAVALARETLGVDSLAAAERTALVASLRQPFGTVTSAVLAEIVSTRAVIGWTTGGHTAVDVNVYAFGPGAARFRGSYANDRMGRLVADLLGLDLAPITAELRRRIPVQARGPGE